MNSSNVILEQAIEKLQHQSQQWNAIDAKNSILLAVYGIILAIFSSITVKTAVLAPKGILIAFFFIWLFVIILGIRNSIASIMLRELDLPPKFPAFYRKYLFKREDETKGILLATMVRAIVNNEQPLNEKLRHLEKSMKCYLPISLGITIVVSALKLLFGGF